MTACCDATQVGIRPYATRLVSASRSRSRAFPIRTFGLRRGRLGERYQRRVTEGRSQQEPLSAGTLSAERPGEFAMNSEGTRHSITSMCAR